MEFVPAKTILIRTKSGTWFGNDYNINLYRGCCHGCIYCDSRSNCYGVEDFDRVRIKKNALQILERELSKKRKKGVVSIGAMSDPYNPYEEKMEITRGALKLLERYGFGVTLDTKSPLVLRDIDLLKRISRKSCVNIKLTVTAASDFLSKRIEPNAPVSSERFRAVRELSLAGIFTGVLLMPILPYITDSEDNITEIVRLAYNNGARFIFPMFGVTLRQNQKTYYYKKIDECFPGFSRKYRNTFQDSYLCKSPYAGRLHNLFRRECQSRSLLFRMEDIVAAYKKMPGEIRQLSLF